MSIKILMADGELRVLEMARVTVSSLQWCNLLTVSDGREAAEHLQRQKFDGLVMADRLPHMDGFKLLQHLKLSHLNAGIPIVMLTGEDDIDTMRRGFKASVTFFAVKPSNRERFYHLFNAVRGAMETERRRHHRLPYHTQVSVSLGDYGQKRFVAESVDISEGGMSVKPPAGVEKGQVLELEFLLPQASHPARPGFRKPRRALFAERDLPEDGPQRVRATARYISPSGDTMGLDFQGLTPGQREAIQHYITGEN